MDNGERKKKIKKERKGEKIKERKRRERKEKIERKEHEGRKGSRAGLPFSKKKMGELVCAPTGRSLLLPWFVLV